MSILTKTILQENVPDVLEIAKGIADYGYGNIAAAAFTFIGLTIMIFVFRWFMKIINRMFDNQQKTLDAIVHGLAKSDNKLDQLKEALTGEIYNQVRVVANYAFDFNKHQVCITIGQIKEENNLEDREAVENKLKSVMENLYNRRNSDFDVFTYNGRKLSSYTNKQWADDMYKYCIDAVYDGKPYHRRKYLHDLDIKYESIKVEFFNNIKTSHK